MRKMIFNIIMYLFTLSVIAFANTDNIKLFNVSNYYNYYNDYNSCKIKEYDNLSLCNQKPVKCIKSINDLKNSDFNKYNKFVKARIEYYFGIGDIYNYKIIYGLITCESKWKANVVSFDGGFGLFQLTSSNFEKTTDVEKNTNQGLLFLYNLHKQADSYLKSLYKKYSKNNNSDVVLFNNIDKTDFIYCSDKYKNDISKLNKCIYELNKWYLVLKYYNGGMYINKFYSKEYNMLFICNNDFIAYQGCLKQMIKYTNRKYCYENVNANYPIRIFLTSDIFKDNYILY